MITPSFNKRTMECMASTSLPHLAMSRWMIEAWTLKEMSFSLEWSQEITSLHVVDLIIGEAKANQAKAAAKHAMENEA